jgi:hypothetical protein
MLQSPARETAASSSSVALLEELHSIDRVMLELLDVEIGLQLAALTVLKDFTSFAMLTGSSEYQHLKGQLKVGRM